MTKLTMKDVIEARLQEIGENPFSAASNAGLERNFLNDVLNGKKASFHARSLPKLATALQMSLDELDRRLTGREALNASPPRVDAFRPEVIPGRELVGARDFPIYAAAEGGNGHLIVSFDAIEIVKRPAILEGVKGAYGLLIRGDSMIPAYRPGDMALIHPHLLPARDEDVILYDHPPDGSAEAIIKHLVGWTDKEWILEQYNPKREWKEFKVDWPTCHRVVGKYARR